MKDLLLIVSHIKVLMSGLLFDCVLLL